MERKNGTCHSGAPKGGSCAAGSKQASEGSGEIGEWVE